MFYSQQKVWGCCCCCYQQCYVYNQVKSRSADEAYINRSELSTSRLTFYPSSNLSHISLGLVDSLDDANIAKGAKWFVQIDNFEENCPYRCANDGEVLLMTEALPIYIYIYQIWMRLHTYFYSFQILIFSTCWSTSPVSMSVDGRIVLIFECLFALHAST